eukprot:scaffold2243_cov165-Amphora_coffeaeformis.AAC.18
MAVLRCNVQGRVAILVFFIDGKRLVLLEQLFDQVYVSPATRYSQWSTAPRVAMVNIGLWMI